MSKKKAVRGAENVAPNERIPIDLQRVHLKFKTWPWSGRCSAEIKTETLSRGFIRIATCAKVDGNHPEKLESLRWSSKQICRVYLWGVSSEILI